MSVAREHTHVLYVHGNDLPSNVAMDACRNDMVIVQEVFDLWEQNRTLPDWLVGVPTLVCTRTGEVLPGSSAVRALAAMPEYRAPPRQPPVPSGGATGPAEPAATEEPEGQPPAPRDDTGGSSLGGFEPLVAPGEDVEEEVASVKITMDEINQALASRGISATGSSS